MDGRLLLATLAFLAAGFGPVHPKVSAECTAPAAQTPSHPITMTPRLGVYFYQDGVRAPLTMPNDGPTQPAAIVSTVHLRRAPFELRIPVSAWAAEAPDADFAVAISDEPCFESMLRLGQSVDETPFFANGGAMADYEFGSGSLMSSRADVYGQADYGWNNLFGNRFNASGDGYRGALVSRIARRFGTDDLMQGDAPITMVFYLDQRSGHPPTVRDQYGDNDVLDTQEVDVVRIVFDDEPTSDGSALTRR